MMSDELDPVSQAVENSEAVQKYLNANSGRSEKSGSDRIKVATLCFQDIPSFVVGYYGNGCQGGFVRGMNSAFKKLEDPQNKLQFKVVASQCTLPVFDKAPRFTVRVAGPGVGSPHLPSRIARMTEAKAARKLGLGS